MRTGVLHVSIAILTRHRKRLLVNFAHCMLGADGRHKCTHERLQIGVYWGRRQIDPGC